MAFKKITLEEWKALGLPVEISTIELNNNFFNKEKTFDKIGNMKNFICPECGSKDGGLETLLDKEINEKSKDSWDSVLQQIECSGCGSVIPLHLAERWDNLSFEDAKKEWKEKYRKNNQKQKF